MASIPDFPAPLVSSVHRSAGKVYGPDFWLCYLANALLLVAVSVLFRYADFVAFFGGSERQLGMIVGVGMIGALVGRLALGIGIDRYGPRHIWAGSLALFTLAMLIHLTITNVHGPLVFVARILMMTGVAGAVGSAFTYISLRVPDVRIAEVVGILGTSGFIGMAIGPTLGDLLFRGHRVAPLQISRMFGLAAVLAACALVASLLATRAAVQVPKRDRPPPFWHLVRRYHPGVILLVAAAMGVGVGLPRIFLRAFTAERHINGIMIFFVVYAAVAIVVRVTTRRLPERIGLARMILIGMLIQACGMLLYLAVYHPWQLALPALLGGTAHALLFPSIVAAGAISFPSRYRGLATTLMLGMLDFGNLIGQPAIGNTLYYAQRLGLPRYPTMFIGVALMMLVVTAIFAARRRVIDNNRSTAATPR